MPYAFDISIFRQIKNQDLLDRIDHVGIVFDRAWVNEVIYVKPRGGRKI